MQRVVAHGQRREELVGAQVEGGELVARGVELAQVAVGAQVERGDLVAVDDELGQLGVARCIERGELIVFHVEIQQRGELGDVYRAQGADAARGVVETVAVGRQPQQRGAAREVEGLQIGIAHRKYLERRGARQVDGRDGIPVEIEQLELRCAREVDGGDGIVPQTEVGGHIAEARHVEAGHIAVDFNGGAGGGAVDTGTRESGVA